MIRVRIAFRVFKAGRLERHHPTPCHRLTLTAAATAAAPAAAATAAAPGAAI